MLVAIAVCPTPPMLVAGLAGGRADDGIGPVRQAAGQAVRRLRAHRPEVVAVVGPGPTRRYAPSCAGTLRGYGVEVRAALAGTDTPGDEDLPPALTIGAWLLSEEPVAAYAQGIAPDSPPGECAAVGSDLAADLDGRAGPAALLVLADGSACHGLKSPGYADDRAPAFDEGIAAALRDADAAALAALDPGLAADLHCGGRAAWQVLAAAVTASGGDWDGDLLHSAVPYGVGYHVAVWERR